MAFRISRNANRFDNYRELTSKFASVGACGHAIKAGEVIGWHKIHGARCACCWTKWKDENRAAEAYENTGFDCAYDY